MKTKINIRYFVGHYQPIYTGAGKSLEKLIFALDKDLFNVEIITAYKKGLSRIEHKEGYTIRRLGNGFFNNFGYLNAFGKIDFSIAAAFYNLFNRKYNILKFIGVGQVAFFSVLVAKLLGKPIINKTTAVGDDDPKKLSESFIGRTLIKLLNKNAAHWVISQEIYTNCKTYTNWKPENLYLITNVVKVPFDDYNLLLQQRQKVTTTNVNFFLFVGVLNKRKGIHILIKLWNELKTDAILTLCGPFGQDEDVNQLLKQNKNKNIKILGELNKDEIRIQYLKSDYFIFPSNREGLPNVVLESMSLGLPIIANNIKGVIDFLLGENKERGIIIPNNDFNTWKNTITNIINQNEELESQAKNAFNWVIKNSSYQAVGEQMKNMYLKVAKNEI